MKHCLIFGLVFLIAGCETIGAVEPPQPTIVKTEVVPKEPKTGQPEVNALTTAKPILCANQKEVFQHLMTLGEIPVATWSDSDYGFLVILLIYVLVLLHNHNQTFSFLLHYLPFQIFHQNPMQHIF